MIQDLRTLPANTTFNWQVRAYNNEVSTARYTVDSTRILQQMNNEFHTGE
jgi:hypothetical protein